MNPDTTTPTLAVLERTDLSPPHEKAPAPAKRGAKSKRNNTKNIAKGKQRVNRHTRFKSKEPAGQLSFFKTYRNPLIFELLAANRNAFILLMVVAYRAQRTDEFNRYDLKPGQALIGDYGNYGMTRQNYRTAVVFLEKHEFLTTESTNEGTIATLLRSDIFDINVQPSNQQINRRVTNAQPSGSHRVTNAQPLPRMLKNEKEGKEDKECKETDSPDSQTLSWDRKF